MQRTIFNTPVVHTVLRAVSLAFLRASGWTIDGALPPQAAKCVLIAAPHTSNWDLPYTLMVAFVLRLNIRWTGKARLFRAPFGGLMRWPRQWCTGFYFIALQARLPIVLAYMDYERKRSELGPVFTPSGDLDRDMAEIKRFYAPFKGRRADSFEAG